MANTVLGKVSMVTRGDYSASATYYALDIVGYGGGSYVAMKEVTGVTPSNDQINWMQLSRPGLPGEQGPQGNPGAAAGFGEATATVDDTSGTPSVEVETSGPDTAKIFTFKFYGLKGTKGDTGNKGDTGDTGPVGPQGVSVVTAQINEQGHLIITLSEGEPIDAGDATGPIGPQGIQGEAGESVGSIQRTSGTGAPGTTDTYTMYSTDGSEIGTFTVYNGTNGTGAGDFMADGSVPMTGALDMGGQKVTNVGAPTDPTDAVRQSDLKAVSDEVDDIISGTTAITIPAATEAKRGGVIIGEGLSVTEDGTLSADDQLPTGGTQGQVLTQGTTGPEWRDAPSGLPDGGAPGQVLTQGESGPEWTNAPDPLPTGGETGQVLTKTADGVAWEDAPEGGVTSFKGRTGAVTPQEGDYTADMVGARPDTWTPSAADVGAVPTSRTVNGQELSQDINLTADNVGARPSTWTPTASDVGAIPNPSGGTTGQILEKTATGTQWADKPSGGMTQTDADARYLQLSGGTMTGEILFANGMYIRQGTHDYAGALADAIEISGPEQAKLIITGGEGAGPKNVSIQFEDSPISFIDLSRDGIDMQNKPIKRCPSIIAPPDRQTVALSASGWSGNAQTITVQGVIADQSAQDIDISCADKASADAWAAGGVWCSNPTTANQLTFTCTTPPTDTINLNIRLWEVG